MTFELADKFGNLTVLDNGLSEESEESEDENDVQYGNEYFRDIYEEGKQ